ncbi:hypothetical protein ABZ835_28240 [Streptomyces sp. NPDC047461]|uniref:hypothetical protein n=1 Tax=Streptomyces sp. NPDC047461 TaxID=3155619 RepID=UPI0033C731E1
MRPRWGLGTATAVGAAALLLAGCGNPTDYTEIVTFTDEHGRVCTAAVVVDQDQSEGDDYEISSLDCDYPPEGHTPGPTKYSPMPERDSD